VNEILELPDGTPVGTGLQVPTSLATAFPLYEDVGPMLSAAQIETIAKSGKAKGRTRFDPSFIKNQRTHGSCQGFASAAAATRARISRGLERVDLSGAYAYSLVNGGRDNGSLLEDGMRACQAGYATEATVGWDAIYPSRYDVAKAKAEAARFKMTEVYAARTEQALFSGLALGFAAVVAVHADNGFMRLDGRGVAGGGQGPGNHAVGADGLWWDGELIADGFNSWDVTYGDDGRMGLTWRRHFSNTASYHLYYLIRDTTDDPQGDNPPAVKE
jgi:hypothetical protein